MDQGASGSGTVQSDVKDMMRELGLREGDLDDVVFEEEEMPPT